MATGFFSSIANGFSNDISGVLNEVKNEVLSIFGADPRFREDEKKIRHFGKDIDGLSGALQYIFTETNFSQYHGIGNDTYYFVVKEPGNWEIRVPIRPNPQKVAYKEPTSTNLRINQFGGKWIEKSGCVTKKILIQGNTGLFPLASQRAMTLPESGVGSGLFYLKLLILAIRYYEYQASYNQNFREFKLIFVDTDKREAWEVEPDSIDHERSTDRKFQNPYMISLTATRPYQIAQYDREKPESFFGKIAGYAKTIQNITEDVVSTALYLSDYVVDLERRVLAPLSVITNVIAGANRIKKTALSTADELKAQSYDLTVGWYNGLAAEWKSLFNFDSTQELETTDQGAIVAPNDMPVNNKGQNPVDFNKLNKETETLLKEFTDEDGETRFKKKKLKDIDDDLNGALDEIRDGVDVPDRTQPKLPDGTYPKAPTDLRYQAEIIDLQGLIRNILATEDFFRSSDPVPNPAPGIFADIPDIDPQRGISRDGRRLKREYVKKGDTLERIAERIYGDSAKWEELKRVNDLRYPYTASATDISAQSLSNVVAYGQYLYYLTSDSYTASPFVIREENDTTLSMNEFFRALGTDIKVNKDGDWEIDARANWVKVRGKDNVKQKILKMFTIEKGTLKANPDLGIRNYSGMPYNLIQTLAPIEIEGMVKIDPRFDGTKDLYIKPLANYMIISTSVIVKDLNLSIPVTLKR